MSSSTTVSAMFDIQAHIDRLDSQLSAAGLSQAAKWIEQKTRLRGRNFSFKDHEYQIRVAEEMARTVNVRKASQIGLSELSMRLSLAYCNLVPGFTCIYVLPTAKFASNFCSTRIAPIVDSSPELKQAQNGVYNTEIVQFGDSFLYVKGTQGAAQAISVPADIIVADEYDFCILDVVAAYESRLTHSPYKMRRNFSTPTVKGYGISAEFEESQQFWLVAKCSCCGHHFCPDYFENVRVPGFTGDSLRQIKKGNIHKYRVSEAYVECPKCGGKPDLTAAHREWVCLEGAGKDAVGFQITPFDAPKIITCENLIRSSTGYARYADFINSGLGLPSEDSESAFSKEELETLFVENPAWGNPPMCMGIDVGHECSIMIGFATPEGDLRVVYQEEAGARELERRCAELRRQFRVISTVIDLYPYSETVWRMQTRDPNLFAAQFVEKRTIQAFDLKHVQADKEKAQPEILEVHINRNRSFDALLELARSPGGLLIADSSHRAETIRQMTDLKRIRDVTAARNGAEAEMFVWMKSKAKHDHWHHSLLYLWLATQLRGTISSGLAISPILGKFRSKTAV